MRISQITGYFLSNDLSDMKVIDGEEYYFIDFKVDDDLTVPVMVSQYTPIPEPGVPVVLSGFLRTCKKYNNYKKRVCMFTSFYAAQIEDWVEEEMEASRTIRCMGKVTNIFPLQITKSGIPRLMIVVREIYEGYKTSIIHYSIIGQNARRAAAELKINSIIEGDGMLESRKHSFGVLLTDFAVTMFLEEDDAQAAEV